MKVIEDVIPTVRTLLERRDLRLQVYGDTASTESLDREVRWVHSSDLVDPTPFLADDLVLLTTGTQFDDGDTAEVFDEYVRRLISRGVLALGFGTEVVRKGVPSSLVTACTERGLPLFEVPYSTPFIAIARANSESIAAQAYARRSWALAAQRAIALAALRPDGLGATVSELSRQLGTWVGLYDATGTLLKESPAGAFAGAPRDALETEVDLVLRRGARAASALTIEDSPFTLQTLGRGGQLRGVIAIASAELDQEGRGVVTAVIAMAGLALEQQQRVQRGRASLRAGLIHTLRSGDPALARRVGREIGTPLPAAPVTVSVVPGFGRHLAALEHLDLTASEVPGSVFFGRSDDDLVLVTPARSDIPGDIAERFHAPLGLSEPTAYAAFDMAFGQAQTAGSHATSGTFLIFSPALANGVFTQPSVAARATAEAILAPFYAHDREHRTDIVTALQEYLNGDGSLEATAVALGVHRHTARSRVQLAEKIAGRSLKDFRTRAELWAAFEVCSAE